jgi:CheY-like chemotaxis protein
LPSNSDIICTDEHRLSQIINNLISNALKFTNDGYVEYGYAQENNSLKFYVRDSGIGIPKEYHEIIFDRFRQVDDKLSRNYGGTGLGLAICKSIVEMMGGRIWIESEPNIGSTFFFTIPYEQKQQMAENKANLVRALDLKNKIILIAEDDYYNYLLLEKLLQSTSAKLLRANNGQEAIDIFNQRDGIDLVLMDIKMPVLNGYDAIKAIRQNNSKVPIIAQTAYAMTDEKQLAVEAGCNYYITKPINQFELFEIFQEIFTQQ